MKREMALVPITSLILKVFFAISIQHVVTGKTTSIKFENGLYNGIVIGIDGGKLNATDCVQILNNLERVLLLFSTKLNEATAGKTAIGTVNVLLPFDWNNGCGLSGINETSEALPNHSYFNSDLKITADHPFAKSLPWTNQYKPCGQGGDSIILPSQFLVNGGFSDSIKAQLLLHEWTKFRYGAFDEIGYEGDALFSPCYSRSQSGAELTCCTQATLTSVVTDPAACSLSLLLGKKESLIRELSQSPTSIMSSPYIDNVAHFCNKTTHNGWPTTKHNVYCKRKSVSEVVDEHSDFKMVRSKAPQKSQPNPPAIQFIRHRSYEPAYAFVIEDSVEMRSGFKGQHIKQSIAQFLEILELGTEIRVTIFTEADIQTNGMKLSSEQDKINILRWILEQNVQWNSNVSDPEKKMVNRTSRQLTPIIEEVISTLVPYAGFSWNVLLFTSSQEVQDIPESVQLFGETSHAISILTFNTSSEWLQWYGIPNTKNVIGLPHCFASNSNRPCSLRTTSFITDYLISVLNNQQFHPRFLEKAAQVELPNGLGHSVSFNITAEATDIKSVYFLLSLPLNAYDARNTILLEHKESAATCKAKILLDYGYVVKFINDDGTDCSFQTGEWEATLESGMPAADMMLDIFLERSDNLNRLIVTPSLGLSDLTAGIYPTTNLTPVYVSVKTDKEAPVVGAQVKLQVYYLSNISASEVKPSKSIILNDDGQGADQTGNDGLYSAFLSGYSKTPAFHLFQVEVKTNSETKVLTSINSPNAILLDEKMTGKCCGKMIAPMETTSIRPMTLKTLHLGVQTVESFDELHYPPGRIDKITIMGDNDTVITLQFEDVTSQIEDGNFILQSIQACCVPSNGEFPPAESDCVDDTTNCGPFQSPGVTQSCYIEKEKLVRTFLPGETTQTSLLACALRAITANAEGDLSSSLFKVDVKAVIDAAAGTPECNSLADDCLPITIFWIIIGCLGLLLLIIILLLVSWCWYCSSQKKKSKSTYPPVNPRTSIPPPQNERSVYFDRHLDDRPSSSTPKNSDKEPKIVNELFINHAYIQDGDGEVKIIADSGEILRKPMNNEARNHQLVPIRPISNTSSVMSSANNMQVFKPTPPPKPITNPMTRSNPHRSKGKRVTSRPDIVHPNPMLRSDSLHDMSQQQQQQNQYDMQQIAPSIPPQNYSTFQPERADPSIVYATVSRTGRLKPSSPLEKTATLPSRRVAIDPHYMVPHNSVKHIGPRQRDPLPNLQPPPQVQAYPTSDSESDVHIPNQQHFLGRPNRYSKPPPYPAGSQLFNQNHNAFGVEGGRDQGQDVVNQSRNSAPPVPPPRYGVNNTGRNSAPPPQDPLQMSSDPDEDSDEWDDEDFDFNPGISYA